MSRRFLADFYATPKGSALQQTEVEYLRRAITVSCKQTIIQIGDLGWEDHFIDFSLYQRYWICDPTPPSPIPRAVYVQTCVVELPIASESADLVILPHLLEFEADQHQVLREAERVLKPEGRILIINFNPFCPYVRYRYFLQRHQPALPLGRFMTSHKMTDWLKLLNFVVDTPVQFNFSPWENDGRRALRPWYAAAYAIKAIKRRYNVIPLDFARAKKSPLAIAGSIDPTPTQRHKHDRPGN